jgi:hypothetical protein
MTTELEEPEIQSEGKPEALSPDSYRDGEGLGETTKRKKHFSTYKFFFDNILFLFMLFAIALLYIRNAHYSENLVRTIDRTKHEVKEIRWEYMTTKAELMSASKPK